MQGMTAAIHLRLDGMRSQTVVRPTIICYPVRCGEARRDRDSMAHRTRIDTLDPTAGVRQSPATRNDEARIASWVMLLHQVLHRGDLSEREWALARIIVNSPFEGHLSHVSLALCHFICCTYLDLRHAA